MATFDELRASRDRLVKRIRQTENWLNKARVLVASADFKLAYRDTVCPETALLLQELNAELKRDNDEAEAKNGTRS